MHRSRPSKKNPKGRWAAYWRDSLNVQHSKSFDFKHEAQRFLDELVVERSVGMDHDPKAERITVAGLAKRWRTSGSRGGKHRARVRQRLEDTCSPDVRSCLHRLGH